MQRSEAISELAVALSKAQAAIKGAVTDSENPFFKSKYADLASVWEAIRAPLTSNGLSVIQTLDEAEGGTVVETTLLHISGQWCSGRQGVRALKQDPQGVGSAITYARRYGLAAIVGVAQIDDDAEAGTDRTKTATKETMEKGVDPSYQKPPAATKPPATTPPPASGKPDIFAVIGFGKNEGQTYASLCETPEGRKYLHWMTLPDKKTGKIEYPTSANAARAALDWWKAKEDAKITPPPVGEIEPDPADFANQGTAEKDIPF
jgi:hypothetical protein